jgi:hypothetical protein
METLPNGRELRRLSPYTGKTWNIALENAIAGERGAGSGTATGTA